MPDAYRNIYKASRKVAGLTQEAAAERLSISVESIRAYETGQRIPHNGLVARMAVVYNDLMLGYEHCRSTDDLMARIIPRLHRRSIMEIVVRLFNRIKRLATKGSVERLLEMADDGKIDQDEKADFTEIVNDIGELVQVGLELQLYPAVTELDVTESSWNDE